MNKVVALLGVFTMLMFLTAGLTGAAGKAPKVLILSDSNTASLRLPIAGATVNAVQEKLMALDQLQGPQAAGPIYLTLNSPGGDIEAGLKIIETAKALHRRVHTLSIFSASMSFILSQLLEDRYVLRTGTMMSHPATVTSVSGTIPGTFQTESAQVIDSLFEINSLIAIRSGRDLQEYNKMIQNELWIQGQRAVDLGFADEVVNARCDETLQGKGPEQKINLGPFTISVVFHKCPLVTDPLEAKMDDKAVTTTQLKSMLESVGGARIEPKFR